MTPDFAIGIFLGFFLVLASFVIGVLVGGWRR